MRYGDQSIRGFLDDVASQRVTPAGGTGAAIGAAIGTALCEMVCLHTVGRDEYADVDRELVERREALRGHRDTLLELADRDADVVDELFGGAPDEAGRTVAMKRATGVPLAIAEACLSVLEHATVVTEKGNRNAVPDAVTGSFLVHSALEAAVFTVRSNLRHLSEPAFTGETETRAAAVERAAETEFERILANVEGDR
jgi:formiminotetrahydrofolate cyclodeaminase